MVVAGFAELSSRLKALADKVDLVSFDIFDTLLERHVEPPDAVKTVASRRAAVLFAEASGEYLAPEALLAARHEAEATLRRQAQDAGFDHECAFTDIAGAVAHRIAPGKEEALYAALVEGELEAEREALYPRAKAAELLAALKAQGKRVVAVSDMYLDSALITRLFQHFGLGGLVDCIYVSADLKLGKYSGRLFRHVLDKEEIPPSRMVHVGDHPHSDFAAPRALGIRALHLHDAASLRRRQVVRTLQWLGERNPFWRGEHLLELIPPPEAADFHYRYGYSCLGPIFCGFVLGVMEETRRRSIGKVFFLAREGDLFRILYSKLASALAEPLPSAGYLYVSRKSVFLPASWRGLPRRYLDVVLYNPRQKGLLSVANALGIPPAEFAGVARRFGVSIDQPIRGWESERYARLLDDGEFQSTVVRHAGPARSLLRRYLEQEGFFGSQRVAVVDIGWNGTIQYALRGAFGEEADFPETAGFYLSFNDGFRYGFGPDEAKGFLYDGRAGPASHNVFALFEELFENAARAHHGTTVGYREAAGGAVEPVLRSSEMPDRLAEREFEARMTSLRQGVLDFADAFAKALRLTGYGFEDIKPALLALAERCVIHPSREETAHLLEIVHAEDLGSGDVMNFREYRLPGLSILLHPKRFIRLLRSSNWKYGTARTLGLPGFNHLLRRIELAAARLKGIPSSGGVCGSRPRAMERMLLAAARKGGFPALNRVHKLLPRKWRA
jgi:FMN phosphatase YigB (HAD superfamily)